MVKAFNPQQVTDGTVTGTNVPGATLIPPAFGLGGVNLHTWTGLGINSPLERVRGESGDARKRQILGSAAER
jgi:hypothetical protein